MSAEPAPHRWVGQTCSVRREPQIWRHVFSCGENLRSDDMFFGVTRTLDLMTCSAFNVGGQSDCFDMAFWQLSHLGFQGAVRNVPFYTWKVIWIVKKVRFCTNTDQSYCVHKREPNALPWRAANDVSLLNMLLWSLAGHLFPIISVEIFVQAEDEYHVWS